jgi:hypothetical protein
MRDAWLGRVLEAGHCRAIVRIQPEAMDFFSDTQETASRFADYVEDLQDVFRCNGIDFGLPEDFFAFARTVKYHSELRGDVLRVVKSVMERETNISFRTILTVIAVASGGTDVATSGREMGIPVKQVIEALIGVGACRQLNDDQPDGLYSDLTVTETSRAGAQDNVSSGGGEAIAPIEAEEPVAVLAMDGASSGGSKANGFAGVPEHAGAEGVLFERAAGDSSVDQNLPSLGLTSQGLPSQAPPSQVGRANGSSNASNGHQSLLNGHGGSNMLVESTLAESLTRLELNSLQLKIYLDSIDQRISRMEPRLEKVAPIALSTPPPHTREEGAARFSAVVPAGPVSFETTPSGTIPSGTVPAVTVPGATEPEPPHNDPEVSHQQSKAATAGRAATGPAAALARLWTGSREFSSRSRGLLPALALVAVLLLAASLFWRFGRETGYVTIHPVNASAEDGANAGGPGRAPGALSAAGTSAGGESQVASAGNPSIAGVRRAQGPAPAYDDAGRGVSPPDKPAFSPKKSAQIPLRSPLPSSSAAGDGETPSETATDGSEDAADGASVPLSNRPINVSSGVMAANLLSGPEPSSPMLASLTRMKGKVVMEAVISKDGTVESLHVIKGHRLLRGAAKDAVRSWRYRPYKIDGVPVDVATIVSVDFDRHR